MASWIVNHHSFGAGTASPYVVVLGRLAEQDDLLVPGAWAGAPDGCDLAVDQPVRVTYDDRDRATTLLRWMPGDRAGET